MKRILIITLLFLFLLTACNQAVDESVFEAVVETELATPKETASPLPTDQPAVVLTVCSVELPSSLFPYTTYPSPSSKRILNLLYPAAVADEDDIFSSSILAKKPQQDDGSVRYEPVEIRRGQTIVDARGELVIATEGVWVRPSGCQATDCAITWNGLDPLEMDQMTIEYSLREGLTWLDGTPVKSEDSVFGFNLANDPDSPFYGWAEDHTRTYTAIDERTVSWKGHLGFTIADIGRFFWIPVPRSRYELNTGWADVVTDEVWISAPPAYGAFKLSERTSDEIILVRNPSFPFAGEVLSGVNQVIFRAIEGGTSAALMAIQAGSCDVLDSSFRFAADPEVISTIDAKADYDLHVQEGKSWTQLVFGIAPAEYDGLANPLFAQQPNYFGDERTRQGIAMCLDRQAMLNLTHGSKGDLWPSFLPASLTQLNDGVGIVYNPVEGAAFLEAAGWRDHDNDPNSPRIAQNVANVFDGTLFKQGLLVNDSVFHQDLAEIIVQNLAECGIGINIETLPAEELYAPGPDGRLFGRNFDMALIAWQPLPVLDCNLYTSWNIPNSKNGWIGTNIAGFADEGYNGACADASLSNINVYNETLRQTEEIFINLLPAVPLISIPEIEIWRASDR